MYYDIKNKTKEGQEAAVAPSPIPPPTTLVKRSFVSGHHLRFVDNFSSNSPPNMLKIFMIMGSHALSPFKCPLIHECVHDKIRKIQVIKSTTTTA